MKSGVVDRGVAAAIEQIVAGFTALETAACVPSNSRDATTLIREVEQVRRLADSASVQVMAGIDESRFHLADGHSSAKTMVRHHARLSNGEAAIRERVGRLIETCPDIGKAYQAGTLSTDHVRSLALVYSNPRVRHLMPARQAWFLEKAQMPHHEFEARIQRWKRLVDQDGPTPANERAHQDRNARVTQSFDTTWDVVAGFASTQGLQVFEIFDKYVDAETLADWEKARAEHGDNATEAHLPRTIQQRRADALWQIFIDAAGNPNSAVPADFVHNMMWHPTTFEDMAKQFFGEGEDTSAENDTGNVEGDDDEPVTPADCVAADTKVSHAGSPAPDGSPSNSPTRTAYGPDVALQSRNVKPITYSNTQNKAEPTPATGRHCVASTTDGNKRASRSGATLQEPGTPSVPTEPKSPPDDWRCNSSSARVAASQMVAPRLTSPR